MVLCVVCSVATEQGVLQTRHRLIVSDYMNQKISSASINTLFVLFDVVHSII